MVLMTVAGGTAAFCSALYCYNSKAAALCAVLAAFHATRRGKSSASLYINVCWTSEKNSREADLKSFFACSGAMFLTNICQKHCTLSSAVSRSRTSTDGNQCELTSEIKDFWGFSGHQRPENIISFTNGIIQWALFNATRFKIKTFVISVTHRKCFTRERAVKYYSFEQFWFWHVW